MFVCVYVCVLSSPDSNYLSNINSRRSTIYTIERLNKKRTLQVYFVISSALFCLFSFYYFLDVSFKSIIIMILRVYFVLQLSPVVFIEINNIGIVILLAKSLVFDTQTPRHSPLHVLACTRIRFSG